MRLNKIAITFWFIDFVAMVFALYQFTNLTEVGLTIPFTIIILSVICSGLLAIAAIASWYNKVIMQLQRDNADLQRLNYVYKRGDETCYAEFYYKDNTSEFHPLIPYESVNEAVKFFNKDPYFRDDVKYIWIYRVDKTTSSLYVGHELRLNKDNNFYAVMKYAA